MKLRQLVYFVAIAEEQQITAAARKLKISQPPLSYELAMLEEELGVKLVTRSSRGVKLTDAGEALYHRARQILAIAKTTVDEVSGYGTGAKGSLTLGLGPSVTGVSVGNLMGEFMQQHNDIRVELHQGDTRDVLDKVRCEVYNFAMLRTPFVASNFVARYAEPEQLVVVAPQGANLGKRNDVVDIEELGDVNIATFRGLQGSLEQVFETHGQALGVNFTCDDSGALCSWVRNGASIGVMYESEAAGCAGNDLVVKKIDCPEMVSQIALLWREEEQLTARAQMLIDLFGGSENPA